MLEHVLHIFEAYLGHTSLSPSSPLTDPLSVGLSVGHLVGLSVRCLASSPIFLSLHLARFFPSILPPSRFSNTEWLGPDFMRVHVRLLLHAYAHVQRLERYYTRFNPSRLIAVEELVEQVCIHVWFLCVIPSTFSRDLCFAPPRVFISREASGSFTL